MKHKILIYGRFLIALTVAVLCGLAFGIKIYPLKLFDAQFVAALQSGIVFGAGISLILLLSLVILSLLFGRIYCSTLCPLGLYQEGLMILFKHFYKKHRAKYVKHNILSYFLTAVLFGSLFGGTVVLLRMVDPYTVAGNALSGAWYGIGFIIAITVLVFFKKRFFCTHICPVGTVLGMISKASLCRIRIDSQKCKMCGLCAKECPCGAIDFKNHSVNNETCVKCLKCLNHCQHKALSYGFSKEKKEPFNLQRRQFIRGGLVLIVLGGALRGGAALSKYVAQKVKQVILPAGAGNAEDFANRCLNCNLCVRNCPQKIIKKANTETPYVYLDYNDSFCDFNCHKCSEICPSGAIKPITLSEKQKTKIATAVVDEEKCVQCGLCVRECPRKIISKEDGSYPFIPFDECIGCGACASVCPVKAISVEPTRKQIVLI
ncbi:MAG: 4Fe-4S binding protein [Alphaproteobacteria bacterium]|nr:4Fe-4S binding protein [Alphaproteobacteria bacterium]